MRPLITISILWAAMAVVSVSFAADRTVSGGKPLVIHFDNGKTIMGDADDAGIEKMLKDLEGSKGAKILVVGHTDNSGTSGANLKLSYQRAQVVRRRLIGIIGDKADKDILVIGQGEKNPVADNRTPAGRARNRRVEIYLAQPVSGRLVQTVRRMSADETAVEQLVQRARVMLRRNELPEALRLLHDAHARGGDLFSSWHGAFGIAGYYTGMARAKIKSHLAMALQLDPFNLEARDYLGRVEARDHVAAGLVTAQMGRNPKDPIVIMSEGQAHEYLELFGVRAVSHSLLAQGAVEAWRCRDAGGNFITYFFDRSKIYEGMFAPGDPAGRNLVEPSSGLRPLPSANSAPSDRLYFAGIP